MTLKNLVTFKKKKCGETEKGFGLLLHVITLISPSFAFYSKSTTKCKVLSDSHSSLTVIYPSDLQINKEGNGVTRGPYLHPNLRRAQPAPQKGNKNQNLSLLRKTEKSTFRIPDPYTRPSKQICPLAPPTLTPLSNPGFLTHLVLGHRHHNPRGGSGAEEQRMPPKSLPHPHIPEPNPLFMPPHPHPSRTRPPFLLGATRAPGLALARGWAELPPPCPLCPSWPAEPTRSSLAAARRCGRRGLPTGPRLL